MRWALVFSLFLVPACTTEGRLARARGEPWRAVPHVRSLALGVSGCAEPARCEDLRRALVGVLAADLADHVVAAGQPAELAVAVQVTREEAPGVAARALGAVGNARRTDAVVTVTDRRGAAAVLRRFSARSGPLTHPARRDAGEQDAAGQFAEDIAAGLRF